MFDKILIANRGEIACRVMRTAKDLGIRTVAVYSNADREALHVKMADEAYHIGPSPSAKSYLNATKVIEIALISGAQAIHPGYGFLSENADFAEACLASNLRFIGPTPDAIRKMGEKNTAKQIMENANVPVVKGYHGPNQDISFLKEKARDITFPILIKAVAGGGGKGMRVAECEDSFEEALFAAKNEARASFGCDAVLLEQYLPEARHVEVQVFADCHGNVVYLFERDCSIQRRHQKILEEAPAPGMTPMLREAMGKAAVDAARAIHYEGAGTVEFLLTPDHTFYFMEMNTRLQVEHPITEKITGLDLVEWQLRVASGEPLPLSNQNDITWHGHAIEARIYAENPEKDFAPSTGNLIYFKLPQESQYVRVDTGVMQGDDISVYYDPLIAKLVVWDQDRGRAIARMNKALGECYVAGVHTNIALLRAITNNLTFIQAKLSTRLIEREQQALISGEIMPPHTIIALAVVITLLARQKSAYALWQHAVDAYSPWSNANGWKLNLPARQTVHLRVISQDLHVTVELREKGIYCLEISDDISITLRSIYSDTHHLSVEINGVLTTAAYAVSFPHLYVFSEGRQFIFKIFTDEYNKTIEESTDRVTAPMPGTVVDVSILSGQEVKKGDRLIVIEAMKMQHTLYAPKDGVIKEVLFSAGDLIEEGMELVLLDKNPNHSL
ncbi:MAG: Carbamoyl-phosphate synthase chain ATP-binding [Gammaproteobacteria bacterium]|jgi:3-methylcrotonyl-CoA carboxylase alpha subunit|nr:Carbamoyl-phosphate synthase chain ATP-binding [Gammaproteobacteria bacterium]